MRLDGTTIRLFSPFKREVANPKRKPIWSLRQFVKFIEENNGRNDCYTSVYPLDETIDKIFLDLDGPKALEDAKAIYEYVYLEQDIPVIPVASGKKGIHLYILLKPKTYENPSNLLSMVTYRILEDTFGEKVKETSVDPHVIGDVRRICRIPNTLRPPENLNWCTYLPPHKFVEMTETELVKHIKSPHIYEYDLNGRYLTLHDLPKSDMVPQKETREGREKYEGESSLQVNDAKRFLKNVLRPALYKHLTARNPRNAVRVAATIDLLQHFTPEEIFNIYRKLNWVDFDPEKTRYYIEKCKPYRPYSNRRLRELGIT